MLISVIEVNKPYINALIAQYEPSREIHVFKGQRKTLPRDAFPSVELEPNSASSSWLTTETQGTEFSIGFTLTIMTDRDDMSVEYIGNLSRVFTEILNNPANMALQIPNERGYNLDAQKWTGNIVQFGMCSSITFNANKEGTIRVATFDWTGMVRESFPRGFYLRDNLGELGLEPHKIPPTPKWNE